jgi:N-acetylneuraminate synthase/N,N'-diacetyllegionaminate synthase
MLRQLALGREQHVILKDQAEARGLVFLSSPFDEQSAEFLLSIGVCGFKIPSGELTNTPFLAHVARLQRPLLVSTGMANLDEVARAVEVVRQAGDPPLALFHCVSSYPSAPADSNLRAMETLRRRFNVPVGWSDHSDGIGVAIAAVALGAELIEKHLTLDRGLPGPDHRASLDPGQFAQLVRGVRAAESALGSGDKSPAASELAIAAVARKSLHWSASVEAGSQIARAHLVALRPGTGLSPDRLQSLLGRRVKRGVARGQMVSEDDLE